MRVVVPVIVIAAAAITLGVVGQEAPSIRIVSPEDGSTVPGPEVEVELRATGVALAGEPGTGGYALLRLDDLPPVRVYSESFVFQGTGSGPHVLRAELRRTDGSRFEPPATDEVRFAVARPNPRDR
jgi:hypothetical protein